MATNRARGDVRVKKSGYKSDNKVAETIDSFRYRVSFKCEWKSSHPVKAIKKKNC